MNDCNVVCVSGRLAADAVYRTFEGGGGVLGFPIAVGSSKKNASGGWDDMAYFFEVSAYGRLADALRDELKKGVSVHVSGKLRQEKWEKDGKKQSRVKIAAEFITVGKPSERRKEAGDVPESVGDDGIPF